MQWHRELNEAYAYHIYLNFRKFAKKKKMQNNQNYIGGKGKAKAKAKAKGKRRTEEEREGRWEQGKEVEIILEM